MTEKNGVAVKEMLDGLGSIIKVCKTCPVCGFDATEDGILKGASFYHRQCLNKHSTT